MRAAIAAITTPREAVEAMVAAGAIFSVQHRDDCLGPSFTYCVSAGGDAERCRAILALVKAKPPAFLQAFRTTVQTIVGAIE